MSSLRAWLMIFSLLNFILGVKQINAFMISYKDKVHIPEGCEIAIVSPLAEITGNKRAAYAYLSLTEISTYSPFFSLVPPKALLSYNKRWQSYLVSITCDAWKTVIEKELFALLVRGFQNVFIDTVDGVEILCQKKQEYCPQTIKQATALISLIRQTIPGKIIINRGFFIYPHIKRMIDGVLIESFFFKRQGQSWVRRSEGEMEWLRRWIKQLKKERKFILAIDYAPLTPKEEEYFKTLAQRLGVSWIVTDEFLQN
jgi:endo-alpha-1,4-polygalactosaminidase (GH114 family)